jgi:hypothetical protein
MISMNKKEELKRADHINNPSRRHFKILQKDKEDDGSVS